MARLRGLSNGFPMRTHLRMAHLHCAKYLIETYAPNRAHTDTLCWRILGGASSGDFVLIPDEILEYLSEIPADALPNPTPWDELPQDY